MPDELRRLSAPQAEDDDFGQAGTLVREGFDDAQRTRLVETVAASLLSGVRSPVLERAFDYWTSVDADVGRRIEEGVRTARKLKALLASAAGPDLHFRTPSG